MLVTKKSQFSGNINSREIDVTNEQIEDWKNGTPIQNAMPNLSVDDREFLLTGTTPEEWKSIFGDDDE